LDAPIRRAIRKNREAQSNHDVESYAQRRRENGRDKPGHDGF
jgi:hypothetical protein